MKEKTANDSPQPGSVYMTVNAFYQPVFLAEGVGNYDFAEFVRDNVKHFCTDEKYLPDHWLFRCDLPDKTMIPTISTFDNDDYPRLIGAIMSQQGTGPAEIVRLRDAAFCLAHGIDPLSDAGRHHALIHNPDYIAEAPRYGTGLHVICAGKAVFPT